MNSMRLEVKSGSRRFLFSLFSFPFSIRVCVYLFCFVGALLGCSAQQPNDDQYRALREAMVREQIAAQRYSGAPAVRDSRVLDVLRRTPRHLFVPPAQAAYAYQDRPLPIGHGQTISQPYMVAIMTELLDTKKDQRALEIGTGSGYQAAVLSPLVAEVYTIEIVEPLGREARERLRALGYKNVEVRIGDGYLGWPEKAPFDRIIVTAGADHIPMPLVEQLVPGGRMVIPVGPSGQMQILKLVIKGTRGPRDFRTEDVMPVIFVPLVREKKPE